jgi:tungstate transport system substrate-binding protein
MRNILLFFACGLAIIIGILVNRPDDTKNIILMATTTTRDSGLLSHLISELEKDTGLCVTVVTFGTGKVLRSAMDGNADIILVHDPVAEDTFMKKGYGEERFALMQNDFVIVGPTDDPANIKTSHAVTDAFARIYSSGSSFASRGDESGTHRAEQRILEQSNINPSFEFSDQYIITGSGMGRTLAIAVEKSSYSITDKATWLAYQNKGDLTVLYSSDLLLKNIYSIITVSPNLFNHISNKNQKIMMNWLKSPEATQTINNFQISGKSVFKTLPNH